MAYKEFLLNERHNVTIYKRRSSRSLRLSVSPSGQVRVSIPMWAPYRAGLEFARSRQAWIETQHRAPALLESGQAVGKAHRLRFIAEAGRNRVSTRLAGGDITVRYPGNASVSDPAVQAAAQAACFRALRSQAEQLLPQRLKALASQHNLEYKSVSIKQLKGRWGSCDHQKNIVLNLFLMQLPWDLIDYVLLHELTHTEVLRHGPDFWRVLEKLLPDAKNRRKQIKNHQPVLL